MSKNLHFELGNCVKNRRIMELASVAAIEVDGELIPVKSRYDNVKTQEILKNKNEFVIALETDDENNIGKFFGKYVILNQLLNVRGREILDDLDDWT